MSGGAGFAPGEQRPKGQVVAPGLIEPLARVLDRLICLRDTEAQLDSALERDLILLRRDSLDAA
jgi:hypothetical protein